MRAWPGIGIMSLLAVCVAGLTVPSAAQDYPAKPVRIVTGQPVTIMDIVSRQLAQRLGEQWGRPVVVENRGGVGTMRPHSPHKASKSGATLRTVQRLPYVWLPPRGGRTGDASALQANAARLRGRSAEICAVYSQCR